MENTDIYESLVELIQSGDFVSIVLKLTDFYQYFGMVFDLHKRILSIVFVILDFDEVSGFVDDCVVFLILKNVLLKTENSFIDELDKSSGDVNVENIFGIVVLML